MALFNGLPAKGAVHRAADPQAWSWDTDTELAALLIEVVDSGNRAYVKVNSKEGSKQPQPIEIPRPGREKSTRKGTTMAEFRKMFNV